MTPTPQTLVYKTVNQLEIPFDIYLPSKARNVPVLLWWHGGGLLQGRRGRISPHMLRSVEKYGHALISADYRLAPQVGVSEIFDDVRDCIEFIRSPDGLLKHIDNGLVDTNRLAVSGSSAGGYLALLAGLYVDPKPNVILPIYPITDPLGYFFTNSQPFPTWNGAVDPSKKVDASILKPYLDPSAEAVANNEDDSARQNFYFYMLQQANLAQLLGFDMTSDPLHNPANAKWRIARAIASCGLPPTYIVHGDVDRAVGVEQADEVVGVMVGEGVKVKYERLRGVDHIFDVAESVELEGMYQFMHEHVARVTRRPSFGSY